MASPVRGERYEERKRTHSVERDRAKGDDRYTKRSRVRSRSRERRGDDRPDKREERRNGVGDDFDRHLDRRERDRDRERDKDRYRDGRDFRRDRDRDRDRSYRDRDKPRERDSRDQDRDGDKVRGSNKSRDKQREAPNDEKDKQGDVKTENGGGTGQGTDQPTEEPEKVENGQDKTHKAEPLSLEELLKKKKEQQEAEAKPRFMSKKERETLALQRRELEAAIQKARLEEARNEQAARDVNERMERIKREEERKAQEEERKKWQEEREREKELAMIKQQYLGGEKVKKRVMKPSEKFRFNFDWEASDDTSRDLNPLYNNLHEAQLLFGRGLRAGIDRREQKKAAAQYEQQVMRKLRSAAGIAETTETRRQERERARLADKYDGFDMKTDRHWSDKVLEDMTERDWRIFREDFNISYKGVNPALPLRRWEEAEVPESIHKAIKRCGYDKPSPIQMAAIPIGLQQRDVIGIAETGSGKTAAFVIPMLVYIMKQPPMTELNEADGPYAVIMAPTRELAQQIEEETIKLAYYTNFRTTSVVGGQSIEEQGAKLRRGCEIVVATPGRLIDCLERRYAVLNQCNYVVLDEADRMIDMGFEPQVIGVLDAMPSSNLKPENEDTELESDRVYRTTYMFSATMPPAVERLARKYLRRPIVINIGSAGRATDNVTQRVLMMKENEKPQRLSSEMDLIDEKRAIVFVNTKKQCDSVYRHLEDLGYRCTVLHGGKTQEQREHGIKGFREDTYNILIATDVAGRGIDVPGVALVVNYDMPNNIEAYTHRIGRTGRAGKKGVAISFVTMGDTEIFYDLKRVLEDSKAMVPPELARHEAAKMKPGSFEAKPKRAETLFAH